MVYSGTSPLAVGGWVWVGGLCKLETLVLLVLAALEAEPRATRRPFRVVDVE